MRLTRRTTIIIASTLYLLALTILAAYALHSTRLYTLPIPSLLTALTVALPPLAGIALETTISLNSQLSRNKSNAYLWVIATLLVYETVIVTLAGTYLYPGTSGGGWKCGLEAVWQRLYSGKDEVAVRAIQDAFECCGLNSIKDRAVPFQGGADRCAVRYERTARCLEPWRAEERKVAVMLLVVPIAVFVWKVCVACFTLLYSMLHLFRKKLMRYYTVPPLRSACAGGPQLASVWYSTARRWE